MITIYKIINTVNNKVYIGSTKHFKRRISEHKWAAENFYKYKRYDFILYNAMNKHGWHNFKFEIIDTCCSPPIIRNDLENYWIDFYSTLDRRFGYNMRTADNKCVAFETSKKQSISQKGRKYTPEQREAASIRNTGEGNPFFGKQHTPESIEHMRQTKIGKTASEETKLLMSKQRRGNQYAKGTKRNKEQCEKISKRLIGNQYAKGNILSEETRRRQSTSKKSVPWNQNKWDSYNARKDKGLTKHSKSALLNMSMAQMGHEVSQSRRDNIGRANHNAWAIKRRAKYKISIGELIMTFNEYMEKAQITAIYPNAGNGNIIYPTLGLCGESGEIAEKVKKVIRDAAGIVTVETKNLLIKEIGDVIWYCAALSRELGVDFDTIATENITKLMDRMERNKISGSGDER